MTQCPICWTKPRPKNGRVCAPCARDIKHRKIDPLPILAEWIQDCFALAEHRAFFSQGLLDEDALTLLISRLNAKAKKR